MGFFDCFRKKANAHQIITAPQWGIGAPEILATLSGENWILDVALYGTVNYVTRPAPVMSDKNHIYLKVRFEGEAKAKNSNNPAVLSLYMQRKGDNWSAQGEYASYRFYFQQTLTLRPGELELKAELATGNWRNVYGQRDEAGFKALLNDPIRVGFVLGDPSTGNTGHGIYASPSAKLTLLNYVVS